MNRNYKHINIYLDALLDDVYPQPPDEGHTSMAMAVINNWILPNSLGQSVLDVGCGDTAFLRSAFELAGMEYTGIAIKPQDPQILHMDFSFLDFEDSKFDFIFARHSLEHSPMPLLTLMEWHRVAKSFLCLILPNPDHYGWGGLNHYSVMNYKQAQFLLGRAGWNIIWEDGSEPTEIRLMCEKAKDIIYG